MVDVDDVHELDVSDDVEALIVEGFPFDDEGSARERARKLVLRLMDHVEGMFLSTIALSFLRYGEKAGEASLAAYLRERERVEALEREEERRLADRRARRVTKGIRP